MNTHRHEVDAETIGRNLKVLLATKGLKQKDLARLTGVSEAAVGKWIRGSGISGENLAEAAKALGVPTSQLLEKHFTLIEIAQTVKEAPKPYGISDDRIKKVPVVGTAKAGENGFYDVDNIMDGYIEALSSDTDSFAIQVVGDSMEPAIRSGWYIWCEPSRPIVPGEFVWVALRNGERLLKELLFERADMVALSSINPDYKRLNIPREQIETIAYVAGICPPSKKIHY
jgi:phage repressor protein C with HTH and peptisase S24 domain